jgi:hypothetical protein
MADVFLSYASEDRERARAFALALEERGWSVWWDRKIPAGQMFDQVIERELETAKSVVVLWSQASIASEWVKNEATVATQRGVMVPVLIDRVPLPLEFRRKQTADLVEWNNDAAHPGFQAVCDALAGIVTDGGLASRQATRRLSLEPRWKHVRNLAAVSIGAVALGMVFWLGTHWSTKNYSQEVMFVDQARKPVPAESSVPNLPTEQKLPSASGSSTSTTVSNSLPKSAKVNLLASENGGHLLTASNDDWQATLDGSEEGRQISYGVGAEAVYAFKDERQATIDLFTILIIDSSSNNVKEFELLAGNDSPTGTFASIGRFQTQNIKLFKTPYQEFTFAPVKARYMKMKVISAHSWGAHPWVHEFQLFGTLE